MLSRTSLASRDFFTITSFSRTAVCMRRTLDWFLPGWGTGESPGEEVWDRLHPAPLQWLGCWGRGEGLAPPTRELQAGLFRDCGEGFPVV